MMSENQKPIDVHLPTCGITIIESRHATNFQMKMGSWKFDKICKIKEGSGFLIHKDGQVPVEEGDLLYLPQGCSHYFKDQTPLTLTIICFNRKSVPLHKTHWSQFLKKYSQNSTYKIIGPWAKTTIEKLFQNLLKEQTNKSTGYETQLIAYTQQLIIFLLRYNLQAKSSNKDHSIMLGLMKYIEENIHEKFLIPELAKSCSMSTRKFSSLFKKISGETVITWINHKRIKYACLRLKNHGNINHVCIDAGFNDLTNFYKIFKKQTGYSPKEFKDKHA